MLNKIKCWWRGGGHIDSKNNEDGTRTVRIQCVTEENQPWIRRFFRSHKKLVIGFFSLLVSVFFGIAYYFQDAINQYVITKFM